MCYLILSDSKCNFSRRDFYLPFCSNDVSFPNLCEAVCANPGVPPSKGSCDNCENKKCNQIFVPVCTADGKRLFANKCHARCAGVEDFIDCPGLNMVIPGKTPLPPNKELPLRLQTVGNQELDNKDENLWSIGCVILLLLLTLNKVLKLSNQVWVVIQKHVFD